MVKLYTYNNEIPNEIRLNLQPMLHVNVTIID